jgi:hypothetical protein
LFLNRVIAIIFYQPERPKPLPPPEEELDEVELDQE